MHLVFAYGTLKQGFPNHGLLPTATFLGSCITVERHPLVIAGEWYTPTLIGEPGSGFRVTGELYELDASALEELDTLEGVDAPLGFTRAEIRVDSTTDPVWVYMKPRDLVHPIHDGPHLAYEPDPRYVPGGERNLPNRGLGTPRSADG